MVIYLVYKKFYADFENGEDDEICFEKAYKNKRKAIKKAKTLADTAKSCFLYMDEEIKNKRNPFKSQKIVDFYKEKNEQETKVSSIGIEEIKLVA